MRTVHGTIRHRLLLNWAAAPAVVAPLLPEPLRPELVSGRAVVGVCALRLGEQRPPGVPRWLGATSDNAAHRIAVEWDGPHGLERGVYVLRRDTAQLLPAVVGGRLFPGVHGRARFDVRDDAAGLTIAYRARDGLHVHATAVPAEGWSSALFATVDDAIAFFGAGDRGWSPSRHGALEGVALSTPPWRPHLVEVVARSSFYDDPTRFPPGSTTFDGALLLRDLPVTWRRVDAPSWCEVRGMAVRNPSPPAPNVTGTDGSGHH